MEKKSRRSGTDPVVALTLIFVVLKVMGLISWSCKFAFAKRSEAMKAPVGLSSDRTFLRKQNGGVSLRQLPVCRPMLNKCTTIIDKPCVQDYNKIIGKDDNKGMR